MNKILFVTNSMLRKKSEPLSEITEHDLVISKKMIDIMLKAPGVGLAANQIGILKRIVTVHINYDDSKKEKIYTLFNPTIISYSEKKVIMEEGCLSLPKQYADIERPEKIKIEYINEKKEKIVETKVGFEARVLQHEIDHLDGKLFVDYLSSLKRNVLIKRVKKLEKNGEI